MSKISICLMYMHRLLPEFWYEGALRPRIIDEGNNRLNLRWKVATYGFAVIGSLNKNKNTGLTKCATSKQCTNDMSFSIGGILFRSLYRERQERNPGIIWDIPLIDSFSYFRFKMPSVAIFHTAAYN